MPDLSDPLIRLLDQDRRYKIDAYVFVWEALQFAQQALQMGAEEFSEPIDGAEEDDEDEARKPQRHITGQDLCQAIRLYALRQYGYMAKTVLNSWGVHTTGDFGEIVFNFIRAGKMRKTKDDRREDFNDQYEFEAAFEQEFRITLPE
jgi:uncharacterized repeat protein (TIGR04138 family)